MFLLGIAHCIHHGDLHAVLAVGAKPLSTSTRAGLVCGSRLAGRANGKAGGHARDALAVLTELLTEEPLCAAPSQRPSPSSHGEKGEGDYFQSGMLAVWSASWHGCAEVALPRSHVYPALQGQDLFLSAKGAGYPTAARWARKKAASLAPSVGSFLKRSSAASQNTASTLPGTQKPADFTTWASRASNSKRGAPRGMLEGHPFLSRK